MTKEFVYKIGFFIVFLLLLFTTGLYLQKTIKLNSSEKTVQVQSAELTRYKDMTITFVNKNNQLINAIQELNIEKKNAKKALIAAGFRIDSLKDKGIKANRLISLLRTELSASGGGEGTITHADTLKTTAKPVIDKKMYINYNDGLLFLDPRTSYIFKDKIFLDYTATISIDIAETWDKDWFLGEKTISLIVTSQANNVTVNNAQAFKFTEKKKFYEKPEFLIGSGFVLGIAAIITLLH